MIDAARVLGIGLAVVIAGCTLLSPFAVAIYGIWSGDDRWLYTAGAMFVPWLIAAMFIGPQL